MKIMKKLSFLCTTCAACAFTFCMTACASKAVKSNANAAGAHKPNYNEGMTMAVLWQQQSGEYKALCEQAWNAGRAYIKSLPAPQSGEKRAAVFDIDETLLDNSPFDAWLVKSGNSWSAADLHKFQKEAACAATPGAVAFTREVQAYGVEVFYVSNRDNSLLAATIRNLKKLDFPNADDKHVLLKTTTSNKQPRVDAIGEMGYNVILMAGDSLDDFTNMVRGSLNSKRSKWVEINDKLFGGPYIILPNSAYGSFEAGITTGYNKMNAADRNKAVHDALKTWTPK